MPDYCPSGSGKELHQVIFDPDTNEMICELCGQTAPIDTSVTIQPTKHSFIPSSTTSTQQQIEQKTQSSKSPPSRKEIAIPISKLNADYTLEGTLSSKMGESNRDAHGNRIPNMGEINRQKFVQKYVINSGYNADKSLRNAMWIIATLTDKLHLNENIKERAAEIYRKAYDANAVRGRSTKWLATASLLYACKEKKIFRNPNDFVIALDPSYTKDRSGRKDLFMNYKILIQVLGLDIPPLTSPISELGRIATLARISEKSVRKAMELYEMIREYDDNIFSGKSPAAISVCILYIATKYLNEHVKQDVITTSGQISTVTLRKRCDEYLNILQKIDPYMPQNIDSHRNLNDEDEEEEMVRYEPTSIKPGKARGRLRKYERT